MTSLGLTAINVPGNLESETSFIIPSHSNSNLESDPSPTEWIKVYWGKEVMFSSLRLEGGSCEAEFGTHCAKSKS